MAPTTNPLMSWPAECDAALSASPRLFVALSVATMLTFCALFVLALFFARQGQWLSLLLVLPIFALAFSFPILPARLTLWFLDRSD